MKTAHFALTFPLALASPALASGFEDIDALEERVAQVAGTPILPVDRRMKLARCPDRAVIDPPAMNAVAVRCPALGWRIRVAIASQPSGVRAEASPVVIRRGDEVDVTYVGDGFEIIGLGTALSDAAMGETVRVKSLTSPSGARGIVVGAGSVAIPR